MKKAKITKAKIADENHQVLTVEGGPGAKRREPCSDCPWRKDAVGIFPAEAFRISAETAYDMASSTFGCHQSGSKKPAVCAGFLLRGAEHNLLVRMDTIHDPSYLDQLSDGGHDLHADYIEMAIANGVAPDDLALAPCRRGSHFKGE